MTNSDTRAIEQQNGQVTTLGGGCFWCLEAVFLELNGVTRVVSGYSGGAVPSPTYQQVCTGTTGHAEVVQVTFDPDVITFDDVLRTFFSIHDPTTKDRQGADIGPQYRSVIFVHTEEQRRTAKDLIDELNAAKIWEDPIVTEVKPFSAFYEAEDYHQLYYARNAHQPYCQVIISPKLAKFRQKYAARLKD
jgi:peptide-methionine (S)-S-oxide reductase